MDQWLGLAVVLAAALLAAVVLSHGRLDPRLKFLLILALVLRVGGAVAYYGVIEGVYGGGDYSLYLERGAAYAERLRGLDFAMFTSAEEWRAGRWWGTQFVFFPVGIVGAMLGPSVLAQFVVFSLISFLGLLSFGAAFHRTHPEVPVWRYLRWILLFPALWFWPSAPGKEALILLGAGLTTLGYCGRNGRIAWPVLAAGLFLVFAIRPQVAMVLLSALVLAHWLGASEGWTVRRVIQGGSLTIVAAVGITIAMRNLGIDEPGASGVGEYLEGHASRSSEGSDVVAASASWRGIPAALLNIWFRPFPWEARSATALLSAVEICALWAILVTYRRRVLVSLREWRTDRLLRLAIPFLVLYSVTAGMTMWNLGIIARQRILLFPFLFLLLEVGAAGVRQTSARRTRPTRQARTRARADLVPVPR